MGWSDVALSLNGRVVHDLVDHFVDRWNFIYKDKYEKKNPGKYQKLEIPRQASGDERGGHREGGERHHRYEDYVGGLTEQFNRGFGGLGNFMPHHESDRRSHGGGNRGGNVNIQLTRRYLSNLAAL